MTTSDMIYDMKLTTSQLDREKRGIIRKQIPRVDRFSVETPRAS